MSSNKDDNTMLLPLDVQGEPSQPGQHAVVVTPKAGAVGGTENLTLREEYIDPSASGTIKSASAPPLQAPPPAYDQHQPDGTRDPSSKDGTSGKNAPPSTPLLGPEPVHTTCPHCTAGIRTTVKFTVTTRTHVAATLCCLVCCCCCLPYCMDSCKNADHYCPNCLKYIGTYEK